MRTGSRQVRPNGNREGRGQPSSQRLSAVFHAGHARARGEASEVSCRRLPQPSRRAGSRRCPEGDGRMRRRTYRQYHHAGREQCHRDDAAIPLSSARSIRHLCMDGLDGPRLARVFEKAAELGVPIMFHSADPDAFFHPVDEHNERYEELAAHPEWSFYPSHFGKEELLRQRDRVFARHPRTRFVAAHVAERPEKLAYVSELLERYPNVHVDIGARSAELGRQPYTARDFFLRHGDRILFGTDLIPDVRMYRLHFRFLETADEYFEYPSHASRQGRWNIYGLFLPDEVLRRVYRENALRLLPH